MGLAAARAVARAGHDVTVLERRSEFTELGAGIQLAPNTFRALDRLGVGARVRAAAAYVEPLRLMDGVTGKTIAQLPLGAEFRERFGYPYAVVHRNDLHASLLDASIGADGLHSTAHRTSSGATAVALGDVVGG